MKKFSFNPKLTFLGIVGIAVSVAVLTVKKFFAKTKDASQAIGVGTLYGVIFAALFLAPFPLNQSIGQSSSDCSFLHLVITPGYGSDHDNGGFSGYICYEDYDELVKCLRIIENNYQNDLVKAWNNKETCAKDCTALIAGGTFGCFFLGVFTVGLGAPFCYWGTAGAGALCLTYCRNGYSNAIDNAECDADAGVENCLIANGATPTEMMTAPFFFPYGVIENPINLPR